MSRSTYPFPYTNANACERNIKAILMQEKYEYVFEKNEYVWKCGNGTWIPIKYIKYEFIDAKTIHVSGWVKADIGGEMNLDGILGGLPKKQVRAVIGRIKAALV